MLLRFFHCLVHDRQPDCDDLIMGLDVLVVRGDGEGDGEEGMGEEDMEDIHEVGMASRVDTSCLGRVGMEQQQEMT